jgi:predicted Zn finger-like uncharacterized protein
MNVSCPDCRSIFRVDPAKVPSTGVRARCSVCSGVISIPAPTGQNTPPSGSERASAPPSDSGGGRSTPSAQSGWDSAPYTPTPPRPAAAPAPSRPVDTSASARPQPEAIDRSTAAATATPPSPASVLPEFTPPPPLPPFRPAGAPPFSAPTAPPAPASAAPPFVPSASRTPTPPRPVATPARPAGAQPSSSAIGSESAARRPLNPFLSKDPNQRAKRLARALVSDIITYHPAKHAEGLRDGTLKQLFREEIKKSFEEYIAQVGQPLAESTTYFQEALNEVLGAGKKIF